MFDVFDTDDLNQKTSEIGQEVSENFEFFFQLKFWVRTVLG